MAIDSVVDNRGGLWRQSPHFWAFLLGALLAIGIIFFDGLEYIVGSWEAEEYSHGFLIPIITLFLIWQRSERLRRVPFSGSWIGLLVMGAGLGLYFLGELSTLYIIIQYAFLIVLFGLLLALMGREGIRVIWVPLLFLVFMIPLPRFLYSHLSLQLQLISSELGAAIIRLFDISVYLAGNVIDLGTYKLQVVEACNGLRYLFPFMSLAFIAAYFFKGAFWKRAIIFLSSIPISILLNSLRIGIIGVLVEYGGPSMAEGFLHDFEGWAVFMVCIAILVGEMWLLARLGEEGRPLAEVFGLEFPRPPRADEPVRQRTVPSPAWASGAVLVCALLASFEVDQRSEVVPPRAEFAQFPLRIGEWQGDSRRMEYVYEDVLKLDDYILADYRDGVHAPVNLYVAYYASQRKGESAHSPRTCIPGDGWVIKDITQRTIDMENSAPLKVNRVLIQKGEDSRLVYYWFRQRGRNLTNEYLVKWYLFWDALIRNRTDGALVRLVTSLSPGQELTEADRLLARFAQTVSKPLDNYIPH